ncbi:hypothetical protein TNCV_4111861 [Trichonephila clavipes]|nr:hypothetical protein TNCV_4111861 [Trichonephila clavipes]
MTGLQLLWPRDRSLGYRSPGALHVSFSGQRMTSESGGSSLLISAEKSPENFDSQMGAVVKEMALVGSNKRESFLMAVLKLGKLK